ncbi:MAG: ABC transporter permease [Anaerofustis sp.]
MQNLLKYKELIIQLVKRDIKLKYRRSFLGYLWSILNPLLMMLVMTIVFSRLFRFDIPNYAVYLLTGQTMFNFMTESTTMAIGSIMASAPLIKKTYVPKYIFPVSKVTSSLVNLLFSLVALLLVMIITGVKFTWWVFMFPFIIIQIYIFCLGLGLFLAQAVVFFRDIQYIYGVLTTVWMYLTPVFYPASILPDNFRNLVLFGNPMYYYISQFRDVMLYGQISDYRIVLGGIGFACCFLLLGVWTFKKTQDKFILYI